MARTIDERPVPGDPGMEDKPRPPMNRLGCWLRVEVLDNLNVPYKANFENDTITILSVKDFVEVARWYGRQIGRRIIPMQLSDHEEELLFTIASNENESIRLRIAGDFVSILLRLGGHAFHRDGSLVLFDTTQPIDMQAILRTLAEADEGVSF